jgi:hypothetical protein
MMKRMSINLMRLMAVESGGFGKKVGQDKSHKLKSCQHQHFMKLSNPGMTSNAAMMPK